MKMPDQSITFDDVDAARIVFGDRDRNILQLEKAYGIEIQARDTTLIFRGLKKACEQAKMATEELYHLAQQGHALHARDVVQAIRILKDNPKQSLSEIFLEIVTQSSNRAPVTPKTVVQKQYVEAIRKNDIVFGWGPAGTGKTYLAMAMAVADLFDRKVDRIILTRPAVEAGERLGFLPGSMVEKVDPYLRPLYDALHDMMEIERAKKLIEKGSIEVAPLAFMRGRTLNKSFVILDEAQNTTSEQMKMFLTRLGFHSKTVITGDVTQIDLPAGKKSGLREALTILKNTDGISFVEFSDVDVVRHPLVQKIIRAYEKHDKRAV